MGDITQLPNPSPWAYPVHSGPGALYPAEANVPPVWEGGGPAYVPPAKEETEAQATAPAPIITTAETWPAWDEAWYPRGPRGFAKTARAAGWEARIGFSRGYVPGAKEGTWEIRDMIGVWVDGYGRRACALWERNPEAEFTARKLEAGIKAGELPSGQQWSSAGTSIMLGGGMAFTYANLTILEEWVALKGTVLPSWYEGIRDKVVGARDAAAQRARAKAEAEAKQRADNASASARVG